MPRVRDIHSRLLLDIEAMIGGGAPAVIFDPAGEAGAGIATTFRAALDQLLGSLRAGETGSIIIPPSSPPAPITVPADTYDLESRIALKNGSGRQPRAILDFAEGSVLNGVSLLSGMEITKTAVGATPTIQVDDTTPAAVIELDNSVLSIPPTATSALLLSTQTAGRTLELRMGRGSQIVGGGSIDYVVDGTVSLGTMIITGDGSGNELGREALLGDATSTWDVTMGPGDVVEPQDGLAAGVGAYLASEEGRWYTIRRLRSWRERTIITRSQMTGIGTSANTRQAAVTFQDIAAPVNYTAGDPFSISNGTVTETWLAVAAAPGPFEFLIGASWGDSLTDLARAITADSALWFGEKLTQQQRLAPGPGDIGEALAVVRVAAGSIVGFPDRIFGTLTAGTVQTQDYSGQHDYSPDASPTVAIPAADPAAKFGFGFTAAGNTTGQVFTSTEQGLTYQVKAGTGLAAAQIGGFGPTTRWEITATQLAAFTASFGQVVQCDPTPGAFTVTLPEAGPAQRGCEAIVKNVGASANVITVDGDGADTVDGAATAAIAAGFGLLRLAWDGVSNWNIV